MMRLDQVDVQSAGSLGSERNEVKVEETAADSVRNDSGDFLFWMGRGDCLLPR